LLRAFAEDLTEASLSDIIKNVLQRQTVCAPHSAGAFPLAGQRRGCPGECLPDDVLIYLVAHKDAKLSTVSYAEFFLGKYWGNRIFRAANKEGFVGIGTRVYGPVLCTCRVVFQDNHEVLLDRYIDLEMADPASRAAEARVGGRVRFEKPHGAHGGS